MSGRISALEQNGDGIVSTANSGVYAAIASCAKLAACGVALLASDYATFRGKGWSSRPAAAFGGHVPLPAGGEMEPFLWIDVVIPATEPP